MVFLATMRPMRMTGWLLPLVTVASRSAALRAIERAGGNGGDGDPEAERLLRTTFVLNVSYAK